ncbi:MAG: transketolase [Candidatus Tectomicrobia bacterium]|nr:transketolase [Candidatus Tectomicrobia bacterium]
MRWAPGCDRRGGVAIAKQLDIDELCVTTIRMLAVDCVQQARSGHPGAPLGLAPAAYVLWDRFLKHHPANPRWCDRDRFVLSAGHASALLYALLHLYGYDISLDDLRAFRQWGSPCAGHPEYDLARGIETTTGPLGQGFGNAVGFALAEAHLAAHFNRPGHAIVDHFTYCLCSDGDMMEGVASETASLAGHLGLGKLIALYDDNHISIEGRTELAFSEDVGGRFSAYGWHVQKADGHDRGAIAAAIEAARAATDRPSLVILATNIGYGSPVQDTAKAHGEPMSEADHLETKRFYGWPLDQPFFRPAEALAHMRRADQRGAAAEADWQRRFDAYQRWHPELAADFLRGMAHELPDGWDDDLPIFSPTEKPLATRVSAGAALNSFGARLSGYLIGGSADLAPSTKTLLDGQPGIRRHEYGGANLHFGVREHGMGTICNGLALHGGVRPYCSTFLVFSDYMRPSIRLAALMRAPVIYVFTHDSIGLGEDGPTHQPVEHLAALRAIPRLVVLRPADANEAAWAWHTALQHRAGPVALVLSRQNLPTLDRTRLAAAPNVARGAYVLAEAEGGAPKLLLLASGSEVILALQAREKLQADGVPTRVISMPSWELFEAQPRAYRDEVLPPRVSARIAIEAGVSLGWERYVGARGATITHDEFGASAPAAVAFEKFGFSVARLLSEAQRLLRQA